MKFQEYLQEDRNDLLNKKLMKKYNITQRDIDKAQKFLIKKHKVKKEHMKWEFVWEVLEGTVFLTFNIEDPNHKNYKSSVNFKFLPTPEG